MITNRLQLALERLHSSDWARFEKLASAFLATDFDDLRTTATPAGDEGRDSELFSPHGEPSVVVQYSVSADWADKIHRTSKRLEVTHPGASVLVYVSNQVIGASADNLKRKLRKEKGLALDIHDRHWFIDRVLSSTAHQQAAEELAQAIVDPYLASSGVQPRTPSDLSSPEAVAALTYLALQLRDDVREKGLTRLAFEALVRAVLIGTDSEHRVSRDEVFQRVRRILPGHPDTQVNAYVGAALRRLAKKALRHWQKDDEYCLSHEEVQRLAVFKTQAELAELSLVTSIRAIARAVLVAHNAPFDHLEEIACSIRNVVDTFLLSRSQAFALAVQAGSVGTLTSSDLREAVLAEAGRAPLKRVVGVDWLQVLETGAQDVVLSDDPAVQAHLRCLSDAYTLRAFLRQTPDVQGAVEKMFSHGQIWLDASTVLPLIAETLIEGPPGRFTRMIGAAREAGLELYVTSGVVEEVERHMNKALACVRMVSGQWLGAYPYLLERFLASGRAMGEFPYWLDIFRGNVRAEEDIGESGGPRDLDRKQGSLSDTLPGSRYAASR